MTAAASAPPSPIAARSWPVHLKLLGMAALWGAAWPAGKVVAAQAPALSASSWRFALSLLLLLGWLLALCGDWERGVAVMRDAKARNPCCLPHVSHGLWADHVRRGEYAEAHLCAVEYRDSAFFWRDLMIACSLGLLGRIDEARLASAQLLFGKPGFQQRGRALVGHFIKDPALFERIEMGLRNAGVTLD